MRFSEITSITPASFALRANAQRNRRGRLHEERRAGDAAPPRGRGRRPPDLVGRKALDRAGVSLACPGGRHAQGRSGGRRHPVPRPRRPGFRFPLLRCQTATLADQAGVSPRVVQRMMRHSTLELTGRYTRPRCDRRRRTPRHRSRVSSQRSPRRPPSGMDGRPISERLATHLPLAGDRTGRNLADGGEWTLPIVPRR